MENQNGIKLIKELKINKLLPSFNEKGLHDLAQEVNLQYNQINDKQASEDYDPEKDAAWMVASSQNMDRNIRCALAYLNTRLLRVERLAWESGKQVPDHAIEKMSAAEMQYFK